MKQEGRFMKAFKISLIAIFLFMLGFIVYRSINKKENYRYLTTTIQERNINETIFIPGNVFPVTEIEIKSQISGILENVYVKIGDQVMVGTPIASIKLVPGTADIERLENSLNLAQIEYDACLIDYERAKRLFDTNTISKVEMDGYERAYSISKERLSSAKNQLDILKKGRVVSKNISNIVTSTTAGAVIDIPFDEGASVIERNSYNSGTTVAIVAGTNSFKFRTLIAEHYLRYISLEDSITLRFNAYDDLTSQAIITKISSKGNLENGIMKYVLDAEFPVIQDMPGLRSGYSATAEIVLNSRKNVLAIEEKHIFYQKDSTYLFLLDGTDKAIKRNVILGISDGTFTEIIEGVLMNDIVITNYDQVD